MESRNNTPFFVPGALTNRAIPRLPFRRKSGDKKKQRMQVEQQQQQQIGKERIELMEIKRASAYNIRPVEYTSQTNKQKNG